MIDRHGWSFFPYVILFSQNICLVLTVSCRVGSCFVCLFVRLIMILHRCKEARVNELILWLLAWWRGLMCMCVPYKLFTQTDRMDAVHEYLHHVVIGLFVRHNMCILCFNICDLTCFHSGQERQKVMAATAANIERSVGRFKDRPGWFSPQGLSDAMTVNASWKMRAVAPKRWWWNFATNMVWL
jgi:hypothetical protein